MRKFRYAGIGLGAALFFLWMSSGNVVYAGGINLPEAQILSYLNGTFRVDGVDYRVTESGKQEARAYLAADDCDLTSKQKNKAIAEFHNNIREGIRQGYLVPVSSNQGGQAEEGKKEEPSKENEPQSEKDTSKTENSSTNKDNEKHESETSKDKTEETKETEGSVDAGKEDKKPESDAALDPKDETGEISKKPENSEQIVKPENSEQTVKAESSEKNPQTGTKESPTPAPNQEVKQETVLKDTGFSHKGIQWLVGISAILCLICLALSMLVPVEKE